MVLTVWYLDFSFLCTFVPGSEKSKVQLLLSWNFRSVEHLLPGSKKSKNFRSMELSHPRNFRSSGVNVPGTFAPWNFHTRGTFAPQTTSVLFTFCSCGTFAPLQTLWKAGKQCVHRHISTWQYNKILKIILERKFLEYSFSGNDSLIDGSQGMTVS